MMKIGNLKRILFGAIGILAVGLLANFGLNLNNQAEAGWSPGDWINEAFWAADPSDGNIIYALYGDGTPGSSPYNQNWTDGCLPNPDNIFHVNTSNYTEGDTNINNIQSNSIYVLDEGNYSISSVIVMAECSTIVGKGENTVVTSSSRAIATSNSNIIIDNIRIQGNTNNEGIYIQGGSNNTINNVEVFGADRGILLYQSSNNTINNVISHDNQEYGIVLDNSSNSNYILDSQVYNHYGDGDAGIMIQDDSKYNVINNTHVYNNDAGIKMDGGTSATTRVALNTINNSQIYNNNMGIYFDGNYVNENIINNSNIYNNEYGYYTVVYGDNSQQQSYNWTDKVYAYSYIESLYSNFEDKITNNFKNIVHAAVNNDGNIPEYTIREPNNYINLDNFYNNNTGIFLDYDYGQGGVAHAHLTYFEENVFFNNTSGIVIDVGASINAGTGNLLGRDVGTLVYDNEEMSKYWITNPISANGNKLITDFTDRTAIRGTGDWHAAEPTKYVIGKNISKQITPVKWTSNGVGIYPTNSRGIAGMDYDTDKYIAEVNMELSAEDEALVEYYYGDGSEFTVNWDENNCSQGAFTVEHIDNTTYLNKITHDDAIGHTIYVLENGTYNFTSSPDTELNLSDNCIALVAEGTGVVFTTDGSVDALVNLEGQENIILDGITLDGNGGAKYGINLDTRGSEKSRNNTLNNIKSYNNTDNGIMLGMGAEYNTIMNTQTWNNGDYGIELYYAGNYNIVNNSLAYNNGDYGLRFGNGSKFNTINNSQFFDNGVGGVFADFTTQQNIINNVHAYNNNDYGINFKRSSGNTLNNIYAYNNDIGIKMTDLSCVNNTFNGDLVLFGNTGGNLDGTNGADEYLSSAGATSALQWVVGNLQTGDNTMSCDQATNPRHTSNTDPAIETWMLSGGTACTEIGTQSIWDASFDGNNIDYMFGSSISKQVAPVGYDSGSIENLENQYDENDYIGEVNPIIWTNPSYISFDIVENSGSFINLDPNTIYEISVNYGTSMINENFDVALTLDPSTTTGHIEVKTGGTWIDIGTGYTNLPYDSTEIRLVITSLSGYYQTITGELYIGTSEYGSTTNTFTMSTKADPTPPTIEFVNNIADGGVWYMASNDWQAIATGIYTQNTRAAYVTGTSECNSGIATPGNEYLGTTGDISLYPGDLDNKYVCIYTEQNPVNEQTATTLSNQIKISKLEFADDVAAGPVYYDIIDINFQNLYNYGYRWVNTGSECGTGLSGSTFTSYTNPIVLNSDTTFNGKYICAYGEDSTGSGRYLLSANDINISDYGNTVNFTDDVEETWVAHDTISVYFSSAVLFDQKKYKWVDSLVDCSSTESMIDYTTDITLTDDNLNGKYFCLYSREQASGIENYLISLNPVQIDIVAPTTPIIESPIAGENVTFLTVETYGASDSESGLTGFEYEIANNATFLDIIEDDIYYTTGTNIAPKFDEDADNYAIRVRSVDAVGNVSDRSSPVEFDYQEINNFKFDDEDDAEPGKSYISNEIEMAGLDTNETILATVTDGVIYRNNEPKGSSTLVQNDDKISIEMFASEEYDETAETELIIANRRVSWDINTMNENDDNNDENNCDLSNSQKLGVASIFNSIQNMYSSDNQLTSFLITMQSMLEDNIALSEEGEDACSMDYLLDMINDELDNSDNASNTHTTPSCKEYRVEYSETKDAYYSPDTATKTYFGSRDELGKYLDSKNPGDCHVNTYGDATIYDNTNPNRHIAPNGKVYEIEFSDIGYSSPDFNSIKYFASIGELRNYININNPAVAVWNHDVDPDFEPVTHTAPNGKTYKIYKTNRGYMSYKFLSVKYFGSLDEMSAYIDRYNG